MKRWVVSRYDDMVAALLDPATFSSQPVVPTMPPSFQELFAGRVPDRGTLIGHDNPTHDRLRAAVNTFFMPRRIARYEGWIEAAAHALVDDFYEDGEVDLRARLTSPLPLKAISHIVGLDPDRWQDYHHALHFFTGPSPDTAQPLIAFHDHVAEVIEERRHDRRDDLISHVWAMRDGGEAVMTDFEMLSLFPGLMLAGHETSSNLMVMALVHLLAKSGAYEAAQRDDAARARALEECFRFEGPITGMPRVVTRPVTLGGQALEPGEGVFLAYASGNRDADHFPDGDAFEVGRRGARQHIAFGQGIHACLGAPLARLLLKVEMRVVADRLPGLRFAIPHEERRYSPFREVRALVEKPFAWDVRDDYHAKRGAYRPTEIVPAAGDWIPATVVARRTLATDVIELRLAADAGPLPTWEAGAHAEIELPDATIRQYSLCGPEPASGEWTIAVRREADGRGGSRTIHDNLPVGTRLRVHPPRNHFTLAADAAPVLLLAGGIGITALLPMAERLAATGADWRLVYIGRSADGMAYRDRAAAVDSARVLLWPADESGRFDLEATLAATPGATVIYACGPERLLAAAEGLCDALGLRFRVERFAPALVDRSDDRPFEAVIASTGRTISVSADETLLQALRREGIDLLSTCQRGTCGSCEVGVVEGEVLHRDTVLTREEHAAGETMMACVSRCAGDRLILRL